jgi:hypothetical protein
MAVLKARLHAVCVVQAVTESQLQRLLDNFITQKISFFLVGIMESVVQFPVQAVLPRKRRRV